MQNHSDIQLIADYLAGDKKSLEVLVGRYLKPLYSFTYRYAGNAQDAEDITQETFVKVWRHLNPVRSPLRSCPVKGTFSNGVNIGRRLWRLTSNGVKRPALSRIYSGAGFNPKKGSFKTWVFAIAKNTAIDFLKKKKMIPFSEFENKEGENVITETLADSSPLPQELLERAEVAQMLSSAMDKLFPKYRMVLFLRYNDHFNFREIAESLGESLDTVKSRHRRALVMLKKLLSI